MSLKTDRHPLLCGASSLLFLASLICASAQTNRPAPASAGLINDALRKNSSAFEPFDFGGQFRARFENKNYFAVPNEKAVDFARNGDSANDFFLLRTRLHLGYAPVSWLKIYGEMQEATSLNDDRIPSPDENHTALRQAWLSLGDAKKFPFTAKVGRQELTYGDQRLVGMADWLNIGRTFDAAKLRYENPNLWVDGFYAQPVTPNKHGFNESDPHDRLSGIYASTKTAVPYQETQLYFLARNVNQHSAYEVQNKLLPLASPRDIYTIGLRVKSLPDALDGWDYEAEIAGQFGRFKASDTAPSLTQEAYAVHAGAGYTWTNSRFTPRLGLDYNFASGDSNPNDGKHGTFDNLYPSNHGLYGVMDFFSLQNLHDVHLAATLKPTKKLSVKLDGHAYWLADTGDFSYAGNGTPRKSGGYGINSSAGNYLGSEIDLTAAYAITRFATAQAGYGHFFTGDYINSSLSNTGGATDANYFFLQVIVNF